MVLVQGRSSRQDICSLRNLRVSPVVRSESACVDPVPRDVVLYVVHEEFPECTLEADDKQG